ncbi:MAG: glycoside hydrolase family 95 protein, partial [Anaerolineae bacterium]|nr:glycoside hydrolase family 95 protein [Anaerolineae bacterium]
GVDQGLVVLYLQFARYLMISASRPGSQAMNLQGIWNGEMRPPWNSAYTININTQMNYWPAETLNLAECQEPLFDLIEALVPSGQETARRMYDARGFVAHHNTDLWRHTVPVDGVHGGLWPTGAAWLSLHYGYHYDHSLERAFLERAYPVVKEAAAFFVDYLVENDEGQLVTGPSISPENTYILPDGTKGQLCMGPAMDSQIVRELLTDCIRFSELLGIDSSFREEIRAIRERLPKPEIGKHGQVMEWTGDWDEAEPGHRHFSHLFAVYPGTQISPRHTPELAQAARVTLERRLAQGGGHTGWSRAWMINVYARLLEAETGYQNVLALLRQSTLPNLFDTHPPFQIDGNFGGAAGISEMLLQSHEGDIVLLPALPAAWDTGYLHGFRARGGVTLDMEWQAGRITTATLYASVDTTITLRPPAGQEVVEIYNAGEILSFIAGESGTATLDVEAGESYRIVFDEAQ